jgi:hypothetical protein
MKKLFLFSFIAFLALASLSTNIQRSSLSFSLKELARLQVSNAEDDNTVNCPGGGNECVRVLSGSTTHIFYKG